MIRHYKRADFGKRNQSKYIIKENEMTTTKQRKEALDQVKMYQSNDWELKEETPEYFLLKKNTSSLGVQFLLLMFFWWTLGLANLVYWAACNKTKKIVK
jgi:hypothetical protein